MHVYTCIYTNKQDWKDRWEGFKATSWQTVANVQAGWD